VCREKRIVVEVDGGQHNESVADAIRDERLREKGYRVLRFWNNDVLGNIDGVLVTIQTELAEAAPTPPSPRKNGARESGAPLTSGASRISGACRESQPLPALLRGEVGSRSDPGEGPGTLLRKWQSIRLTQRTCALHALRIQFRLNSRRQPLTPPSPRKNGARECEGDASLTSGETIHVHRHEPLPRRQGL
jgi:hypothetical protein